MAVANESIDKKRCIHVIRNVEGAQLDHLQRVSADVSIIELLWHVYNKVVQHESQELHIANIAKVVVTGLSKQDGQKYTLHDGLKSKYQVFIKHFVFCIHRDRRSTKFVN